MSAACITRRSIQTAARSSTTPTARNPTPVSLARWALYGPSPAIHRRLPRIADPASATERAAAFAAVLLAIFVCQELAEGPAGSVHG